MICLDNKTNKIYNSYIKVNKIVI